MFSTVLIRSVVALGLLSAAGPLAACGAAPSSVEDFEGEQRAVAQVVEDLQSAGQRREAGAICRDVFTRALRDRVAATGADCEKELQKALDDADAFELEVESVEVSGDQATARVRGTDEGAAQARTFELVREDGRWRVDSLSG